MELAERFRGCLLGLAVGDAVGTTVEFQPRGSFPPVTDLTGGGPFHLNPGEWTDDASMALCLASSLSECGGFDARDQMERYVRWWEKGYWSSNGTCFDIGITVSSALRRYRETGEPNAGSTDPHTAGNGCLMRLAPVPMFYYPDRAAAEHFAAESSRTTHGAAECLEASRLFARMLVAALAGSSKADILTVGKDEFAACPKIAAIANAGYLHKPENEIRGSGYVVASLEAALWCFATTDSFKAAILKAANLGEDADTTAAICGQLAGAHYGVAGIPSAWLQRLARRQEIDELAVALLEK